MGTFKLPFTASYLVDGRLFFKASLSEYHKLDEKIQADLDIYFQFDPPSKSFIALGKNVNDIILKKYSFRVLKTNRKSEEKQKSEAMLICTEKYEGIHHTTKPSAHTKNIIKAKMLLDAKAKDTLANHALQNLSRTGLDFSDFMVVPVQPRIAKVSLPASIANRIASKLKLQFNDALYSENSKARASVKDKNIILVDDVIYSGKTLKKADAALKKAGAKQIVWLVLAKSTRFDMIKVL